MEELCVQHFHTLWEEVHSVARTRHKPNWNEQKDNPSVIVAACLASSQHVMVGYARTVDSIGCFTH
jgi:hypothetical protein